MPTSHKLRRAITATTTCNNIIETRKTHIAKQNYVKPIKHNEPNAHFSKDSKTNLGNTTTEKTCLRRKRHLPDACMACTQHVAGMSMASRETKCLFDVIWFFCFWKLVVFLRGICLFLQAGVCGLAIFSTMGMCQAFAKHLPACQCKTFARQWSDKCSAYCGHFLAWVDAVV